MSKRVNGKGSVSFENDIRFAADSLPRRSIPGRRMKTRHFVELLEAERQKVGAKLQSCLLIELANSAGSGKHVLLRGCCGYSVHSWNNHLDPNVKKGPWTEDEDQTIFELHKLHGNQWALIAGQLNGRYSRVIEACD